LNGDSHINCALRNNFVRLGYRNLVWLRHFHRNVDISFNGLNNRDPHGYRPVDGTSSNLDLGNSDFSFQSHNSVNGDRNSHLPANCYWNINALDFSHGVWYLHRNLNSGGLHDIIWPCNRNSHCVRFGNRDYHFLRNRHLDLLSGDDFVRDRHGLSDHDIVGHHLRNSHSRDYIIRLRHSDGNRHFDLVWLRNSDRVASDHVVLDWHGNRDININRYCDGHFDCHWDPDLVGCGDWHLHGLVHLIRAGNFDRNLDLHVVRLRSGHPNRDSDLVRGRHWNLHSAGHGVWGGDWNSDWYTDFVRARNLNHDLVGLGNLHLLRHGDLYLAGNGDLHHNFNSARNLHLNVLNDFLRDRDLHWYRYLNLNGH